MIDSRAKDAYWAVVEDCLVEIHRFPRLNAQRLSQDLRTRIDTPPVGLSNDIFYHAEPFDIACDLTGQQFDISQYRYQYETICNSHNW